MTDKKEYEQLQHDAEEQIAILTSREVLASNEIQWAGLKKASLLSKEDLADLLNYDKQGSDIQSELLEEKGVRYAEIFLSLLGSISQPQVHKYVLALIEDLLSEDEERIQFFLDAKNVHIKGDDDEEDEDGDDQCIAFKPFSALLYSSSDSFIAGKSAKILSWLLVEFEGDCSNAAAKVIRWCLKQVNSDTDDVQDVTFAINGLQTILKREEFCPIFVDQNGLQIMSDTLSKYRTSQQMLYQSIYVFWLASFLRSIAFRFHKIDKLIPDIVDIIRKNPKIKIRRIALATMRNLVVSKKNIQVMLETGFMRVLAYLTQREYKDKDMEADLEYLGDKLQEGMVELTSYDVYKKEVMGGKLTWSPVHKSEKFWKENVSRFEENNFAIIKRLIDIISNEKNPEKIAIACYDIGEFVRFHPRGRRVVSERDGKTKIMMLMANHADAKVQKHALLCVQKMIVTNWELLARS